jgi:8-amino-7-oxononanoate synthase
VFRRAALPSLENVLKKIRMFVSSAKGAGLYPPTAVTEGLSSEPEIVVAGRRVVSFASANYLGLANDPRVKKSVIDGIERYGLHPCGSRCVSGTLDVHRELERRTAEFKNAEDAMLFPTGMMANLGAIPAIVDMPLRGISALVRTGIDRRKNVVFSDEFNHASIIDGYVLARAEVVTYRHNDVNDLAAKMNKFRGHRALLVTDGVFSMDGDIAHLPELVELAGRHDAILMVDDAHATGVLGAHGKGTLEHFGLNAGVDVNMGTFSKALGIAGGFIAAEHDLIEYLRVAARTYMFSGATFGSLALGAMTALEISGSEPARRQRLWASSRRLRDGLAAQGINVLGKGETPIVPVLICDDEIAQCISHDLFQAGFFAPCITYPAVAKKRSRIRFSVTALHTDRQIDDLVTAMSRICAQRGALMAA